MDIFIRRLPNATTRLDLMQFITSALNPKWYLLQFSPLGTLRHCDICRIEDPKLGQVEYHGIAHVTPASAALSLIHRLDGEIFKNKRVEVRKFFRRSIHRDRRDRSSTAPDALHEQRKQDRRRPGIRLDHLHAGITADTRLHGGGFAALPH
ncbi:RNA-binding protein [Sedimenticola hydrogenitrophicus]|uniref:RNA-binding protein n=1 Tax=Sedimenticola hydrogenitrophicus TaxID=2967975 RepID=UPI0021A2D94A|nr:RNA-binding protein [Sedimenticola hydrogenitrophicus]